MSRRGFTLLELVTVVAILAIMAALAIPNFRQSQKLAQLKGRTRELMRNLNRARAEAASGRVIPGGGPLAGNDSVQAGIRFVNGTIYQAFLDDDNTAANVQLARVVDLSQLSQGGDTVVIQSVTIGPTTQAPPAGIELRFRRNGTLTVPAGSPAFGNAVAATIVLQDTETLKRQRITIPFAGTSRSEPLN